MFSGPFQNRKARHRGDAGSDRGSGVRTVMDEFNSDNPPSGPATSNQGMTILKEMNELDQSHDTFMDSLKGDSKSPVFSLDFLNVPL